MSEKALFLLKPDALDMSLRALLVRLDFYKQLQINNLSVLIETKFIMTYDMLISYQPVLSPDFQNEMTKDWKDMTMNYQLGSDHKGKEHILVIIEGYNSLKKGLIIKKYIRNKYCSPWYKYAPENLIHAPDDNVEYERDLCSFESVINQNNLVKSMEFLFNTRREK